MDLRLRRFIPSAMEIIIAFTGIPSRGTKGDGGFCGHCVPGRRKFEAVLNINVLGFCNFTGAAAAAVAATLLETPEKT
jgi:hypothetical protein